MQDWLRWRAEQALAQEKDRREAVAAHAGALRQAGRAVFARQSEPGRSRNRALVSTIITMRDYSLRLAAAAQQGFSITRPPDGWKLGYLTDYDVPGIPSLAAPSRLYAAALPDGPRARYQAPRESRLFPALVLLTPSPAAFGALPGTGDPLLLIGLIPYPRTASDALARQLLDVDSGARSWDDVPAIAFWIAGWDLAGAEPRA